MTAASLIIRDLFRCNSIQHFINCRYKDESKRIIDRRFFDPRYVSSVSMKDGTEYHANPNLITYFEVLDDYRFSDIRPDDVVLDIGANIGCFAIKASSKLNRVYAVEPLLTDELAHNVRLNNANVSVICAALGDGTPRLVQWGLLSRVVQTKTLGQLKQICGGRVDFLKCDCEGGEWLIDPADLAGISRIEMEIHCMPGIKSKSALLDYIREHYYTEISRVPGVPDVAIVHATVKGRDNDISEYGLYEL